MSDAPAAWRKPRAVSEGPAPRDDDNRDSDPMRIVDPITLQGEPVPERRWLWPGWIPCSTVTGLYGLGGEGKSLLAQQLMTSTAIGALFLGRPVRQVKSLGIFCEDPAEELHIRQADINRFYGCDFGDLENMRWLPRLGEDNIFMAFDSSGRGILTPFFDRVLKEALDFGAELVVVDTVADTFAGNENDRSQVRQFVSVALGRIAREINGCVLALAHPSRAGANSGEGDGGSTAWSASLRSRAYLSRPSADPDAGPDPDLRTLTRKKANYAAREDAIKLRWQDGVFVPADAGGIIGAIERKAAERVFLDLLDRMALEGQNVSHNSHAGNYAPKLFASRPEAEGYRRADFARAMQALFSAGQIRVEPYGRTSDRREKIARVAKAEAEASQ